MYHGNKYGNQSLRILTTDGDIIEFEGDGLMKVHKPDGTIFAFDYDYSLHRDLRNFRRGQTFKFSDMMNDEFTIQSIEQPFVDKRVIAAKKNVASNDRNTGMLTMLLPGLFAMVREMYMSIHRLAEEPDELSAWLEMLPFPVLYELFENAPAEIRFLLAPVLMGLGITVGGGMLLGQGVNKLRYATRNAQLRYDYRNDSEIDTSEVISTFKDFSKTRTAEQAYVKTKRKYDWVQRMNTLQRNARENEINKEHYSL